MFKRKRQTEEAPTPTMSPLKRLNNLEKARMRVRLQLGNPKLAPNDRPRIEAKLASISAEIEELKEQLLWS